MVACRLPLRVAIACRSASLSAAAVVAVVGEGVVRACRNALAVRGGIGMSGGAAGATVNGNRSRCDKDMEGAEH